MRAAILAGGKGTRLRPYTTVLPKPLVPVGDRPILELIIRQLAGCGFDRLDLCVGHLGELIRAYLDESSAVPDALSVSYHWEEEPMGTAGALRQLDHDQEPLLVMNGDILSTIDYADLMRSHIDSGAALTVATYRKDVQMSLGVVECDGDTVTDYIEKPTLHYEVSMGVYIYSAEAIERIPPGYFDFPDVVKALLADGQRVATYRFDGSWFDIGTLAEHETATAAYHADPTPFESAD
jgi:NDP-sugar pyrophosphorylase family protein